MACVMNNCTIIPSARLVATTEHTVPLDRYNDAIGRRPSDPLRLKLRFQRIFERTIDGVWQGLHHMSRHRWLAAGARSLYDCPSGRQKKNKYGFYERFRPNERFRWRAVSTISRAGQKLPVRCGWLYIYHRRSRTAPNDQLGTPSAASSWPSPRFPLPYTYFDQPQARK
jgi:hypothetical protein